MGQLTLDFPENIIIHVLNPQTFFVMEIFGVTCFEQMFLVAGDQYDKILVFCSIR